MFQAIRKHISSATVVAFMALVFAITGGAFAASGNGGSAPAKASASAAVARGITLATESKAKPKAKAGPRGPAGKNGAPGPAGPAGATGPAGAGTPGATGPQGPQGPAGANGTNGTNGANGKEGKAGPEGTFGGQQLPSGKTLTGQWAASGYGEAPKGVEGQGYAFTGVTYALPVELEGPSTTSTNHYVTEEEWSQGKDPAGCTGTAEAPGAAPGNLCVFVSLELNVAAGGPLQGYPTTGTAVQSGFQIEAFSAAKGPVALGGSWAVTAK